MKHVKLDVEKNVVFFKVRAQCARDVCDKKAPERNNWQFKLIKPHEIGRKSCGQTIELIVRHENRPLTGEKQLKRLSWKWQFDEIPFLRCPLKSFVLTFNTQTASCYWLCPNVHDVISNFEFRSCWFLF